MSQNNIVSYCLLNISKTLTLKKKVVDMRHWKWSYASMEVLATPQWKWWTRTNENGGHASVEVADMHQWEWWTCTNGSGGHASIGVVDTPQWK